MKSIGIFFLMMSSALPDPLSSVVLFCITLSYSFLRKDVRARTLATMAADFIMLIINASSMIYSSAVFGDLAIHDGNRTSSSAPSGGFQWATSGVERRVCVVLRAICSSISLAIVLADLIRIKIGMSSGHMVNGGVSEVRRWITYEEIVVELPGHARPNCRVGNESLDNTSSTFLLAAALGPMLLPIIKDPRSQFLRRTGCSSMCRKCQNTRTCSFSRLFALQFD